MNAKDLAVKTAAVLRAFVAKNLAPFEERLDKIAVTVTELAARQPEKGEPGKDGNDGEGRDGRDGRDALSIEVIEPDQARSYPRATWAAWRGGLMRSVRTTAPLDDGSEPEKKGWHVVVRGIASFDVAQDDADPRRLTLAATLTDGTKIEKAFVIPSTIYRGVYRDGAQYAPGDLVTWAGSLWHCNEATTNKPDAGGWTLATKRGRDGKDGTNGTNGKTHHGAVRL